MITGTQKEQLLNGLNFAPEDQWLKKIFLAKIKPIEETGHNTHEEDVRRDNIFENLVSK